LLQYVLGFDWTQHQFPVLHPRFSRFPISASPPVGLAKTLAARMPIEKMMDVKRILGSLESEEFKIKGYW